MTTLNISWWILIFIALSTVTLIQIFYYLYFFARLALYRKKQTNNSIQHPVTVIVCARDEAANLVKNIPGVLVQEYSTEHEVIIVNDNSIDESKYLLEAFQKDYPQLQVLELKQEAKLIPGKKFPLSMGIKTARYEVLLLTDADCIPATEHWIQQMQAAFEDDIEIVLGYGPYHKSKGMLNRLIRFETFHTAIQYLSYALAGKPYMGVGRNLAYRKDIFFRNKGFSAFNHIPSGDDDLFINRAANARNTAIVINKEAHTLSDPKNSWVEWMEQKTRHYTTGKYYKGIHKFLLGLYSVSHFLFYPLVIAGFFLADWRLILPVLIVKLGIQAWVYRKTMEQLDEADLWPWFPLLDLWMFIYYLIFAPALLKKPKVVWK